MLILVKLHEALSTCKGDGIQFMAVINLQVNKRQSEIKLCGDCCHTNLQPASRRMHP